MLAGGASSRMGRDKATLRIGSRTVMEGVIASLTGVCDEVIVAGRRTSENEIEGAAFVEDAPGTAGPLAGLAAALEVAQFDRCLLVACDMPFLSGEFLRYLANCHLDCDALVPAPDGSPQPLHAAYSRSCLPTARLLLDGGAASMRDLLSRRRVRYVKHDQCFKLDPMGLSWFNMNNREDYRTAKSSWARLRSLAATG